MNAFTIEKVNWRHSKRRLKVLRDRVFVCEWRIPRQSEFDEQDLTSDHVLILDSDGSDIATGRITPDGEIGRIAVVSHHRGKEIYDVLYNALLEIAKDKDLDDVFVQCELNGVDHFQEQGFQTVGGVYMDSGIPRQKMSCPVGDFSWSRVELTH
jgi:predicted GNAT family N-acyltransferase